MPEAQPVIYGASMPELTRVGDNWHVTDRNGPEPVHRVYPMQIFAPLLDQALRLYTTPPQIAASLGERRDRAKPKP